MTSITCNPTEISRLGWPRNENQATVGLDMERKIGQGVDEGLLLCMYNLL